MKTILKHLTALQEFPVEHGCWHLFPADPTKTGGKVQYAYYFF